MNMGRDRMRTPWRLSMEISNRQIESASGIEPHPEPINRGNHFIIVFANVLA